MKILFDFFPLLVFFVAFKLRDIFVATGALIVATLIQLTYLRVTGGKISQIQLFSAGLIALLGGTAILFHDERFLFWKPTVANLCFAGAILFTLRGSRTPAAKMVYEEALGEDAKRIPPDLWRRLSWQWIVFFLIEGVLNLVVAFNFETATWVSFKVWGLTSLSLVMGAIQMFQLHPYLTPPAEEKPTEA